MSQNLRFNATFGYSFKSSSREQMYLPISIYANLHPFPQRGFPGQNCTRKLNKLETNTRTTGRETDHKGTYITSRFKPGYNRSSTMEVKGQNALSSQQKFRRVGAITTTGKNFCCDGKEIRSSPTTILYRT